MERIELVPASEFEAVRAFYWELIDQMQGSSYLPGWEKGVYPADEFLRKSLEEHSLYVMKDEGQIIGAMVLNQECNEGYRGTCWAVDAAENEVTVVHALGVLPGCQGRGCAARLVEEAIRLARENRRKAVRLDVLNGNLPALRLYEKCGFQYRRTASMFYEDTGWTDYLLYELVL